MSNRIQLTEAEWKIMLTLWERSPRTMMEITRALEPSTGWSKFTVTTMLKRMAVKGTVCVDDTQSVRTYVPAVDKERVAREQTDTLLSRLFGGKASLLVSNMVERGAMDDEEIREIMEILKHAGDNREENNG